MPATEGVPDSVPRSRRMRRTQSTYNGRDSINCRQSDRMCNGTHQDPPAASANGPKSNKMTTGTVPALGMNTRKVIPNKGTGSYKRRSTNSGTKVLAPALVNGDSLVGEHALNSSSSTSTVVVQFNKKTVVENGCPSPARPKSRRWQKGFGSKKRSRFSPPAVYTGHRPMPPTEDEDWEKDIQEVVLVDWEKRSFGLQPYGPEDLISFALRDLSLHPMAPPIPPIMTNYSPARSHPCPVAWNTCYRLPLEEGQFSDVDE